MYKRTLTSTFASISTDITYKMQHKHTRNDNTHVIQHTSTNANTASKAPAIYQQEQGLDPPLVPETRGDSNIVTGYSEHQC